MMNGKINPFKSVLELVKFVLCGYIAFSAAFGFIMASERVSFQALLLFFCILFLAMGCAALNNIQDRTYDSYFSRTCHRVLVVKTMDIKVAVAVAISGIILGLSGLWLFFSIHPLGMSPFLYGMVAVFCYNFLYTPLKKRTLLSIIPGTLSGMLPPLIGWTAAGADGMDPQILNIMIILGLWQIPHFFLLLLEPGKTLKPNIYPHFRKAFSKTDLKIQTLIWCGLYSLSLFLYLISFTGHSFLFSMLIALNAVIILLWIGVRVIKPGHSGYRQSFTAINLSIFLFMAGGIYDHLV